MAQGESGAFPFASFKEVAAHVPMIASFTEEALRAALARHTRGRFVPR
jgi:hypothetical protein